MAKYTGFDNLVKSIASKGKVRDPGAVAASIGRKKYGAKKMAKAAAFGKKNPNAKPMLKP